MEEPELLSDGDGAAKALDGVFALGEYASIADEAVEGKKRIWKRVRAKDLYLVVG